MANDVETTSTPSVVTAKPAADDKTPESLNAKCSVCRQNFKSVQECLKHELLEHSLQKKTAAKTGGGVDGRIKATNKFLNAKEKQEERVKVHKALEKCQKGQELAAILKVLCMNTESLGLIFTRIQTCLEKELRSLAQVKIYPFGSIASRLALRDSDIDIFLDASQIPTRDFSQSPKHRRIIQSEAKQTPQQRGAFNRINSILQRSPLFVDVFPIRAARVPIIKCKHRDTGFSIDINISCPSSMENTQFISELVQSDRRIHELFVFLKLWAKNMQIIGRANMTSYCLITMIIFYLQQPFKMTGGAADENKNHKILNAVRALQKDTRPRMVQGINYSFDLKSNENKPLIPKGRVTIDLIKGFFQFYKDYNFEDNMISPFYGRNIPKKDFTVDKFKEYNRQLVTITQFAEGNPAEPIQLDRCMCVQDSFGLNHNVARTMLPPNKKYFVMCLENAATICEDLTKKTAPEILEKLLYETICIPNPTIEKEVSLILNQLAPPSSVGGDTNGNSESSKSLSHFMAPSKSDLNSIANAASLNTTDPLSILRFWCEHYTTAIQKMLSDFYNIDLQPNSHSPQKQQRLDNEELSHSWHISASVDLWSNRFFQKSLQQTFWDYQMGQTERLHSIRRQDAKFAVQLSAILSINIQSDYQGLTVNLTLPDGSPTSTLIKKDPLRKFFNVFKNTLQNYCLKDALPSDDQKPIKTET